MNISTIILRHLPYVKGNSENCPIRNRSCLIHQAGQIFGPNIPNELVNYNAPGVEGRVSREATEKGNSVAGRKAPSGPPVISLKDVATGLKDCALSLQPPLH